MLEDFEALLIEYLMNLERLSYMISNLEIRISLQYKAGNADQDDKQKIFHATI